MENTAINVIFSIYSFALAASCVLSVLIIVMLHKNHQTQMNRLEEEIAKRTFDYKKLLNIVCHDIATPINILQIDMQTIRNEVSHLDPKFQKICQRMNSAINNTYEILDKVRNLHKLKSGQIKAEIEEINLTKIVEEIMLLFEAKLLEKNLTLHFDNKLSLTRHRVYADASMLKNQVLSNLLSNAIKFSNAGTAIYIKTFVDEQSVKLTVEDEGIGIPEEIINNLFEFDKKKSRRGTLGEPGTGFGMPVAKVCLSEFGADILVTSREKTNFTSNHGTAFTIVFPAVPQSVLNKIEAN